MTHITLGHAADIADTQEIVAARFRSKVNYDGPLPEHRPDLGPCWIWQGCTNGKGGYGLFRGGVDRDKGGSRKWILAHRYAYTLLVGVIPDHLELDHLCRVRRCVNPKHVEVTTHKENTLRGESPAAQQARREFCLKGHPFDKVDRSGRRRCSICDREKELRRYVRRYGRVPKSRQGNAK